MSGTVETGRMLDSETEDLLNGPLRAVAGKPTVEALRQISLELGRTLGGAPEPVAAIEDGGIDVDGRSLRVRVYRPDSYAPLPVILYCHGGGFVWGEPEGYDFLSRGLAKECGALLLALSYSRSTTGLPPSIRIPQRWRTSKQGCDGPSKMRSAWAAM